MLEIMMQTWILIVLFVINLIFFLVMSFISPYYKRVISKDWLHIILICIIIIIVGIYMFLNVSCSMRGQGMYCRLYSWCTIFLVLAISIWTIMYYIYKDHQYRQLTTENKKPLLISKVTSER